MNGLSRFNTSTVLSSKSGRYQEVCLTPVRGREKENTNAKLPELDNEHFKIPGTRGAPAQTYGPHGLTTIWMYMATLFFNQLSTSVEVTSCKIVESIDWTSLAPPETA